MTESNAQVAAPLVDLEDREVKDPRQVAWTRYYWHVTDNQTRMRELREQANKNQRFFSPLGDQWPDKIRKIYQDLGIPAKSYNRVWEVVSSIAGRETTNRFQAKLLGRDPEDSGFADALTAALRHVRQAENLDTKDSNCFRTAHVQRASAQYIFTDAYQSDVPRFRARRVPINELLLDFSSTETNFEDMRAIAIGRWMAFWEFIEYFPELEDKYRELRDSGAGQHSDFDGAEVGEGGIWAATLGDSEDGTNSRYFKRRSREIFVVDFEWKDRRPLVLLELPGELAAAWQQAGNGPLPDLDGDQAPLEATLRLGALTAQVEQQIREAAAQPPVEGQPEFVPMPTIRRRMTNRSLLAFQTGYSETAGAQYTAYYRIRPEEIYHATIVGNNVVRVRRTPDNHWSILPLIPYLDDDGEYSIPYGTVDNLRPRQELLNMFFSSYLHAMATMPKAQVGIDPNMGIDQGKINEIRRSLVRHDRVVDIPGGQDAFFELPAGKLPDGLERAWQMVYELIPAAAGTSEAALGTLPQVARVATRLVEQQEAAQSATQAESFDSLRHFRINQARKIVALIVAFWTPDQLRRVAGRFAQYVPDDKSLWLRALEFDVDVGEEPSTRSMAVSTLDTLSGAPNVFSWLQSTTAGETALARLLGPVIGSEALQGLVQGIQEKEPQVLLERLAEMTGADPAQLQGLIEQLTNPEEENV